MLTKLLNVFKIPELRNKLFFTIGLLCVYRIGFYVPLPGINAPQLRESMTQGDNSAFGQLANYLSVFSGGDLTQGTVFGLGIMPYISASIIIQLMGTVVPALEKLKKEGEPGIRKITEWTRYLTVIVCVIQSAMYVAHFTSIEGRQNLYTAVLESNRDFTMFLILAVAALSAGSVFLMWLGEQIDHYGIGNGVSLIITAGIIARMPLAVRDVMKNVTLTGNSAGAIGPGGILFLIACFIFVVAGAIFLTQAQRRIVVQQAKHMRGRRVYGGSKQYLPLRVNHAGVMPIIFASTLITLPAIGLRQLAQTAHSGTWWGTITGTLARSLQGGTYLYEVFFCVLIFFFSYFWNTVQFQPKEMANQLRDYGSFVPGLRPGKRTADYLENVMSRITYVGAAFLCVIAIIPQLVARLMLNKMDQNQAYQISQFLGGTGLLIVISVMLDFVNRIEANLVMRNYSGFMDEDGGTPTSKIRRPKSKGATTNNPNDRQGIPGYVEPVKPSSGRP